MRIDLTDERPDIEVDALGGTFLDSRFYDRVIDSDADVYRPDGEPLILYRREALDGEACQAAYAGLRTAAGKSRNRGIAAGKVAGQVRVRPIRKNGTISRTDESARVAESGVVGFYDRYERNPYCRLTAFNMEHPERFAAALPYIRAIDRLFAEALPERYQAQRAIIEKTHPDFRIHGTVFTTITVNRNFRTACHKDVGDYPAGFGVMSVLEGGEPYKGGLLVFPKYRIAVDMRTRGVCLADVHQWHGNTPLIGRPGRFERISCVLYYRSEMWRCGSAEQELARAKSKRLGESRKRWD